VSAVEADPILVKATAYAFEAPYRDKQGILANLLQKMEQCREQWREVLYARRLYSAYIPIIQASMMGKTRMFFALPERDVFVFYICLREADSSGFPKGFPRLTCALTEPCTEGFYSAFILAALEALDTFKKKYVGADSVFKAWFGESQKQDFWASIVGLYNHIFSELHILYILF
jgi:hypothetical protein